MNYAYLCHNAYSIIILQSYLGVSCKLLHMTHFGSIGIMLFGLIIGYCSFLLMNKVKNGNIMYSEYIKLSTIERG